MRTGIGYDLHRIIPTVKPSHIKLGGVAIPCSYEIQAHSDGDVLLHATVDACLGALALGDIGQLFPDTAEENRNRDSKEFLSETLKRIYDLGWEVSHLDSILFLEEPKISPHSDSIRRELAQALNVELCQVSVKAKTMEGIGPVGERKAIAAQVVVSLKCRS